MLGCANSSVAHLPIPGAAGGCTGSTEHSMCCPPASFTLLMSKEQEGWQVSPCHVCRGAGNHQPDWETAGGAAGRPGEFVKLLAVRCCSLCETGQRPACFQAPCLGYRCTPTSRGCWGSEPSLALPGSCCLLNYFPGSRHAALAGARPELLLADSQGCWGLCSLQAGSLHASGQCKPSGASLALTPGGPCSSLGPACTPKAS